MALRGLTNDEKIWNFFSDRGVPEIGIAGLLANFDCESALNPKNVEDYYAAKLGYTDDSYTAAVDSGTYGNFVNDAVGFGINQATWFTRKQDLLLMARKRGTSVGDLETQLEYIWEELTGKYKSALAALLAAKTIEEATSVVMLRYEQPADQSASAQNRRASYAKKYYEKFVTKEAAKVESKFVCSLSPINGYYHFKKGSRIQLSKNFWSYEFDCHGVGCCTETIISVRLVELCQIIRDHFGTSVTISSPYRCIRHNSSPTVVGATGSRHTKGDAADIVVSGHAPSEVAKFCESIGILGIGLYETASDGYFVHIDVRDYKSFWYGQACAPRTTFGGANTVIAQPQKIVTNPQLLVCGSSGQAVKDLQERLIRLGYDLGMAGADGEFGGATSAAVRKLQSDNGLVADGKVGSATMTLIDSLLKDKGSKEYIVTAVALNVRSGAGTNFSVVKTVNKNTILSVFETRDGWGKIESGWVSMQYLREKG